MTKEEYPITQGVRLLREKKIDFIPHLYPFVEHGGTHHASEYFHISEHQVVKTLILKRDDGKALIVLMHGDCEVSVKQLARELGVKHVSPCEQNEAQRYTGYMVGGISPFGTRTNLQVYAESTIFELDRIFINGGKRGFMVEIKPGDLEKALSITKVNVAI
jgi:Cys-tRNA(Pro) deacylase